MSDSVRPHRLQPMRLPPPWDSPGKNTGVGCHFLLQCMKVKSESEDAHSYVAAAAAKLLQSCPTLCDPIDGSPPGFSVHGILQARVLEWGAIAFSLFFFCQPFLIGVQQYLMVQNWEISSLNFAREAIWLLGFLFWKAFNYRLNLKIVIQTLSNY